MLISFSYVSFEEHLCSQGTYEDLYKPPTSFSSPISGSVHSFPSKVIMQFDLNN